MNTFKLMAAICCILLCTSVVFAGDLELIFSDDFSTNSLSEYTHQGGGYVVSHDAANGWATIRTGDNRNVYLGHTLPLKTESGYFEFDFYPTRTYPFGGITRILAMGDNGYYLFHFSQNSNPGYPGNWTQYRARIQKVVNGQTIYTYIFVPDPYIYALNQWHKIALHFSPEAVTGYMDGKEIITYSDPNSLPIAVSSVRSDFLQQDQYLDNLKFYAEKQSVNATIDIDPDRLNLKSKGQTVTCYIEIPGSDISTIDALSIKLNDTLPAYLSPVAVGDNDDDGEPDLMVKFDRQQVISLLHGMALDNRDKVTLTVSGELGDGTPFIGTDTVTVLKK